MGPYRTCAVALLLTACGPTAQERLKNAADAAGYGLALDQCYEASNTMAEYETCAKKADEVWRKK